MRTVSLNLVSKMVAAHCNLQNCIDSSGTCRTYYLVRSRGLASSTGWAQPVRIHLLRPWYLLTGAAIDALFYDVYTRVSELHLADVGIDVEWSDVDVFEGDADRWGKTREYFAMRTYRLPVGRMKLL